MSSLYRIQWIDECIRSGAYPNVNRISERFEISRRQALRDIEYMRDSLGAPIEYCLKQKGYVYTNDAFTVTGLWMSESEQQLLSSLAAHYRLIATHDSMASETFLKLAELLGRLSRTSTYLIKPVYKPWDGVTPFRAIIFRESTRWATANVPSTMQPYYRGQDDYSREVFEFYDSHDIISAILASGTTYKIIYPNWLRHKLVQYIDKMCSANTI